MIVQAQGRYPAIGFLHLAAESLDYEEELDMVFCNAPLGAGLSDTERQVTREPATSSRHPSQSLGLGDTLKYAQLTSVESKGVKYEQAATSNKLPLRMATSQRM